MLLKNEGNVLPLDASRMRNVAVIGPSADIVYRDWYAGNLTNAVTPLQGIRDRIGAADRVHFDDGATHIAIQSRVNNKWVTAGVSGSSALLASASNTNQTETFLAQDFGWGCTVLRSQGQRPLCQGGRQLHPGGHRCYRLRLELQLLFQLSPAIRAAVSPSSITTAAM